MTVERETCPHRFWQPKVRLKSWLTLMEICRLRTTFHILRLNLKEYISVCTLVRVCI